MNIQNLGLYSKVVTLKKKEIDKNTLEFNTCGVCEKINQVKIIAHWHTSNSQNYVLKKPWNPHLNDNWRTPSSQTMENI